MKRFFVIVVAALMAAGMPTAGARQSAAEAEKLLASAKHKAAIDGDLKGAIEEYKKAFAAAGSNRALAAQALLRMAECHQNSARRRRRRSTSGWSATTRIRKTPSCWRAHASTRQVRYAACKGDRSVWVGLQSADGFGTISPDGRFLTYTDWKNGASLALRDLTTGTNHRLTSGGPTQFSAISRDGKQVAYEW